MRYPIPKLSDLEESTKKFAGLVGVSYGKQIYHNIRSGIGDILGSYEDISRETKRIEKAKKYIQQNLQLVSNSDMRGVIADEVRERCGVNVMGSNKLPIDSLYLQSMLHQFRFTLELLRELAKDLDKLKDAFKQAPLDSELVDSLRKLPHPLGRWVLLTFGVAELMTVCEEIANGYKDNVIEETVKSIKSKFDYKDIRDILAHWEDYARGVGCLQCKGEVPNKFPDLQFSPPTVFKIYHYKADIVELMDEMEELVQRSESIIQAAVERDYPVVPVGEIRH